MRMLTKCCLLLLSALFINQRSRKEPCYTNTQHPWTPSCYQGVNPVHLHLSSGVLPRMIPFSKPRVWLVDFENYQPPPEYLLTLEEAEGGYRARMNDTCFMKNAIARGDQEHALKEVDEIISFMRRVFDRSGVSPTGTYVHPFINPCHCGVNPRTDLTAAAQECQEAVCGAVEGLLRKTGLQPTDIDMLISTCSIYCPTPSMASMIINHFKMRSDIKSFHLAGMGCGNGVIALNLIKDMLKVNPNQNLLFVTHETTSPVFYSGRDRSRLVPNTLFRMGAAAMLLSNKRQWAGRAKYELELVYRIHTGANDASYRCIEYGPDEEGINGVKLEKAVLTEASNALTIAMKEVAPHIMTWGEIIKYVSVQAQRQLCKMMGKQAPPPYQPAFNKGVQHFLLHAGGAKVLDGLGKALRLSEHDLEPSRAVLYDYGNVSSATTWYTLGYVETMRGVKAGDTVLQVGVGSGIKCGVNVWKALRDVDDLHTAWESRVTPERRSALTLKQQRHSWPFIAMRVVLLLVLLAMAVLVCLIATSNLTWVGQWGVKQMMGRARAKHEL